MTISTAQLISGFGLVVSTVLTPAFSATVVDGGVIHFRGAIVANPCEISPQHHKIEISCPENKGMQTRMIKYEDVLNGRGANPDVATVSMRYLDPEKSLAIVQIQYR
ncbi:type 1 fimbrial protein [Enterobacter sp. RHBSTW-00994]|uniref:type 1 fimbrial protein n=1 Tax=Enterobacteriaceae TaxID=543 RepID=UPI0015EA0B38|nr:MULTISPECIES: type 1 fimbrial protein [Enterobacteriaceae]MBM3073926.1 type 1 fimbrial protein [Lelliottia sp. RWM.1]QLR42659.1 type 1 fimbrial protein [Enterobacter sp. RHBSTW-00994]